MKRAIAVLLSLVAASLEAKATDDPSAWRVINFHEGCMELPYAYDEYPFLSGAGTPRQLLAKAKKQASDAKLELGLDHFAREQGPDDPPLSEHPWAKHFSKTNAFVLTSEAERLQLLLFTVKLCKEIQLPLRSAKGRVSK